MLIPGLLRNGFGLAKYHFALHGFWGCVTKMKVGSCYIIHSTSFMLRCIVGAFLILVTRLAVSQPIHWVLANGPGQLDEFRIVEDSRGRLYTAGEGIFS